MTLSDALTLPPSAGLLELAQRFAAINVRRARAQGSCQMQLLGGALEERCGVAAKSTRARGSPTMILTSAGAPTT